SFPLRVDEALPAGDSRPARGSSVREEEVHNAGSAGRVWQVSNSRSPLQVSRLRLHTNIDEAASGPVRIRFWVPSRKGKVELPVPRAYDLGGARPVQQGEV